jgi:ubiquinone/menaquinone biosynthesis C-methylase UbiE
MDQQEYRRTSHQTWERIAPTWASRRERIEESAAPVRQWLVEQLGAEPGDTVLELACGTGDTGFQIARAIGEDGRLISTDFSSQMVEAAKARAAELGLRNVEHRVMDAERMDLGDDSVDRVVCRFGYMLMADPALALSETRRVLRPGGRLAVAVWGPPDRNPWAVIGAMTLVQRGHMPPPDPTAPGVFSMGSAERVRSLLEVAGFSDARVEEIPVRFAYADIDDYVAVMIDTAGPFAMVIRGLPESEREEIKVQLGDAFRPFSSNGGYELPGLALGAVGS